MLTFLFFLFLLVVGGLLVAMRLLGGVPVPEGIGGLKNFSRDIISAAERGEWVAIYPEAHIWPYYTGIRPFGAAAFKYPAKSGAPVFAFTTTYKKRRFFKKPAKIVYVDGPFFAEGDSLKEKAGDLRDKVYAAMCERAKLSDCAYCEYYKVESAALAASLNAAQDKGVRGKRALILPEEQIVQPQGAEEEETAPARNA